MKKGLFLIGLSLLASSFYADAAVKVSFVGSNFEVISITPDKKTGLNNLFVAYDASQLSRMIVSDIDSNVKISKYSNLGGGYAQEVNFTIEGSNAVVNHPEGDMGYIIENNGTFTYIWLVNYLPHRLSLNSAGPNELQECDNTRIDIIGDGDAIYYYTIDGRPEELDREIEICYNNLEWSDESISYEQIEVTKIISHLSNPVIITPPLYCNSTFTITGDKFLKAWDIEESIVSPLIYANGISVHTEAEQTNTTDDDPDAPASNQIRSESQGMGGSAPADISFRAYTTDAVVHNEWQLSTDETFEHIDYRFTDQNIDYTFNEEGMFYMRFVGSNSDGSCEKYGDTYTISIGESDLRIPNAFTPNEDGVNDEWKVGYRSLIKFSCSIFDRYGNEIFNFTDPSIGWDGKYKGKYVKPGVYFYVIEAKGADGKKYKKGGDINLIKSKRYTGSSNDSPVTPAE